MNRSSVLVSEDMKLTDNFIEYETSDEASLRKTSAEMKFVPKSVQVYQTVLNIQKPTEILKSEGSTITPLRPLRRASLMKLFDPFHSVHQALRAENEINYALSGGAEDRKFSSERCDAIVAKDILSNPGTNVQMQKLLISLESPKKLPKPLIPKNLFTGQTKLKKYTEEEFNAALQAHRLELEKAFSGEYVAYKTRCVEQDQSLHNKLSEHVKINKTHHLVISELSAVADSMKAKIDEMKIRLQDMIVENEVLKVDIKTSKEDLGSMENAFSEIYKRYETSRIMIKNSKENEEHLNKHMSSLMEALIKQNSMNEALESRAQDLMSKANEEIESAKKSDETEKMILEAQLKKSQIKISSLENDLLQDRSNSEKLASIYDDLMAKLKS